MLLTVFVGEEGVARHQNAFGSFVWFCFYSNSTLFCFLVLSFGAT